MSGMIIGKSDDTQTYYRFINKYKSGVKRRKSNPEIKVVKCLENHNKQVIISALHSLEKEHNDNSEYKNIDKCTFTLPSITPNKSISLVKNPSLELKSNKKCLRPSLSEQLATIGANAEALTASIKQKAGMEASPLFDSIIFSAPSSEFSVGRLTCRYPAPVQFFRDRVEYTFHHPYEASEIRMHMYYQDLSQVQVTEKPYRLSFRVPRRLVHFADDYDPARTDSVVAIVFPTALAISQFRQHIVPLLHMASRPRR